MPPRLAVLSRAAFSASGPSATNTLPSKVQTATSSSEVVALTALDTGAGVAQPAVQNVTARTADASNRAIKRFIVIPFRMLPEGRRRLYTSSEANATAVKSVRTLRHPWRLGPRHRENLRDLLAALRAAHAPAHGLEGCRWSAPARQRSRFGDSPRTRESAHRCDRRSRINIVQYVGGFLRDTSGVHCYFPEWADRPVEQGTPQESDRNSYLAGGYAEEFGYSAQRGQPPAAPAPQGDPEQSRQWRVQIGGLHPGYPECPRPLDRGVIRSLDGASDRAGRVPIGIKHAGPENMDTWNKPAGQLRVVCVGQRNSPAPTRIGLLSGLILVWKDFRIRRRALGGFF